MDKDHNNYTIGEVVILLKEMDKRNFEKHQEQRKDQDDLKVACKAILEQVTRTNGRVGKLENWRGFITGGVAVIGVLLVPLFFKLF